jgi:hypothetical protein
MVSLAQFARAQPEFVSRGLASTVDAPVSKIMCETNSSRSPGVMMRIRGVIALRTASRNGAAAAKNAGLFSAPQHLRRGRNDAGSWSEIGSGRAQLLSEEPPA